ncbi:MAG: hypothetical protein ABI597_13345 [Gammaproteobacteria bacterium]
MYLLYSSILLMLLAALSLLALPFIAIKQLFSWRFLFTGLFTILFSLSLYHFSGNHAALTEWILQGKKHYQLQTEVKQLGGIDGIIAHIKQKLQSHPDDAQGWFILGKLYFAQGDYNAAKAALYKAHLLLPQNHEIKSFYERAGQQLRQK